MTATLSVTPRCAINGCRESATVDCRWGSVGEPQYAALCDAHRAELWEGVRGPVAVGLMHFTILPAGGLNAERGAKKP